MSKSPYSYNFSSLFLCAHINEALPLIEALRMKRIHGNHPLERRCQLFYTETVLLAVIGIGKLKAAAATGSLLAFLPSTPSLIHNIGIAGASCKEDIYKCFAIHKIIDHESATNFYPDVLFSHPFEERQLLCVAKPLFLPEGELPRHRLLVDMESSGIWQAAQLYLSCDQICFTKIASDNLAKTDLSQKRIHELLEPHLVPLVKLSENISEHFTNEKTVEPHLSSHLSDLAETLRLSFTQKKVLERELRRRYAVTGEFPEKLEKIHFSKAPRSKTERNRLFGEILQLLRDTNTGVHCD